jgi:F-type H+-transporting ATPase subunit b
VNSRRLHRICFGLLLALALALPFHSGSVLHAQTGGESTTPEAQSPQTNKQEEDANEKYLQSPKVVSLGKKLGLNPAQSATAFGVFNFVFLAILGGWVLMKTGVPMLDIEPLPQAIRGRNQAIRKHITEAEVATSEAHTRLDVVERRLAKLDDEIASMRKRAEQDAAIEGERFRASVEEEKRKIMAAAEQEIAAATFHAQQQLKQHAAELAIEQAARKLVVSAETDRLLVQGFARQLGGEKKDLN